MKCGQVLSSEAVINAMDVLTKVGDRLRTCKRSGCGRAMRELVALHAWLDTWSGLGAIVVGMDRHGYHGVRTSTQTSSGAKGRTASIHGPRRRGQPEHSHRGHPVPGL